MDISDIKQAMKDVLADLDRKKEKIVKPAFNKLLIKLQKAPKAEKTGKANKDDKPKKTAGGLFGMALPHQDTSTGMPDVSDLPD